MTEKVLAKKLAALAVENGFDFTAAELLEFGAARPLSDTDAENAARGGCCYNPILDAARQKQDREMLNKLLRKFNK